MNATVKNQKTSPKYELTNENRVVNGVTLHRIKALKDFADVKMGDLGGFIENEDNLSHDGNCWVYDDAMVIQASVSENAKIRNKACVVNWARVYGNAVISDQAWVLNDKAHVYDNAVINGNAKIGGYVFGNAVVSDNAVITEGALIYDNARVYENAYVSGKAQICQFTTIYGNAVLKENKKFSEDVCGVDKAA
ncbi:MULTISPECIES: hypothetical protein [unclassified Bartonella]|uniref:hypothetical protein n=1 Tax=unclassified Bartonella TaxID=2645622 RepID=UPI0035CEFC9E